jgi:DNA-binding NarL/FixJ family response regulator
VTDPSASDRSLAVIGREAERASIEGFVRSVRDGACSLVFRGESGIGKSTLWRLARERCRDAGIRVLTTRPAQEEMPLNLSGLVDLLDQAGADPDPIVGEEQAFARGRATLGMLRAVAGEGPVVVAIDDLQWLDPVSADALRYAIRRLDVEPVGILVTVRSDAEEHPLVSRATLPERTETVEVGPLDVEELRVLLGTIVPAISRPTLRRIAEASGGNPLYAIELVRSLPRERSAPEGSGRLRLPGSLQAAVLHRIEGLPDELLPLLELVATLGPASVEVLQVCMPDADVPALVELAEREGSLVITEDLDVRFSHPLVGSAVYGRMTPIARRGLHAKVAARTADPDIRARHVALSADEPDPDAAQLLEDAARRAGERGGSDLAAVFARHSLRLTAPDDEEGTRRRALMQIGYLAAAGEVSQALQQADRLIAALPPGPGRAEALVARARLEDADVEAEVTLLERALEDAGTDLPLRGRVLDQLGWVQGMFLGDLTEGIATLGQALEIAVQLGDDELEMSAAAGLANMESLSGSPRRELIDRAVELEERIGQPLLWAGPRVQLATYLRQSGDLTGAQALYEATHAEAMRSGNERWRPHGLYNLAGLACYRGDFVEADDLVRQALDAAHDTEDAHVEAWILYPAALVAAWLGRSEEARTTAERLRDWGEGRKERPQVARASCVLGFLELSEGRPHEAVAPLVRAVEIVDGIGIRHPAAIPALPEAVEALAGAGELDTASELLARLEAQATKVGSACVDAATDRARGVLLIAFGRTEEAASVLARSAVEYERLGFRPDAARAVLARGRALLREGQRTAAADTLADARDRFAGMGAILWESRATEELERAAPGRSTGELTSTEARIADLVAEGLQNKQIASTLFVSVATVEAHLTRIYRKLSIRSRSELARLVADGTIEIRP